MALEDVKKFITDVGFPVAVTAWLLFERYRSNGALLELVKRVVTLQEEWQHRWLKTPESSPQANGED